MGSLFAFNPFIRKFGTRDPTVEEGKDGDFKLSAGWQTGLIMASNVGTIIGLHLAGKASERYGIRKPMVVALLCFTAFIFVYFFATTAWLLLLGQFFAGMPLGVFQALPPVYSSDVCPISLRPYLTASVNLSWLIGQILASGMSGKSL